MAYDDNAKRLVVKVIGTVESGLNYSAINYNDPITVGIAQWYGTRAAAILRRTINENIGSWVGVPDSPIVSDLMNIPADDPWWNSRRLTQAEGESLRPMLGKNREIQEDQCIKDMEVYKDVAINIGIDPDANTDAMLFFFTMYHQGPVYAFEVVDAVGPTATLEEIHAGALANPVLGQYATRYNEAFNLIREGNTGGGGDGGGSTPTTPDGTVSGETLNHVSISGQTIMLHMESETIACYPNGADRWIPSRPIKGSSGTTPAPTPTPDPGGGGGGDTGVPAGGWVHPLPQGSITSPYGNRDYDGFHAGADISSVPGSGPGNAVLAPCDMEITQSWEHETGGLWAAGSFVKGITTSGPEYTLSFFHMVPGSLVVQKGQKVTAGTKLGIEGSSGNVNGTHLHLEMWPGHMRQGFSVDGPWYFGDGTPIDPIPILKANGVNI